MTFPSEWRLVPFAEVLENGTRNGIYKSKLFHGRGAKVVNMGELFAHPRLASVEMRRIEVTDSELGRFGLESGDLLFARRSLVAEGAGKCSIVMNVDEPTVFESSIIRARTSNTQPLFLYYYFNSPLGESALDSIRRHVAVAGITGSDLAKLRVPQPPLEEQRVIAGVLGALDDKIELNRRMNETLAVTSSLLFADQFEGGDEGDRGLGDLADIVDCLHSKKPKRQSTGLPLLQLNNIRDDGLIDLSDAYAITESDYAVWTSRMEARQGDCVITNVGRVGVAAQVPPGVTAALGRNMTGVRCKAEYPYPTFVLEALLSRGMRAEIERRTDAGTILSALNVRSIPKLRLPCASHDVLRGFEERARPLRARMELNLAESRTLARLRDALLPKLMSGELRVGDAEVVVKGAT